MSDVGRGRKRASKKHKPDLGIDQRFSLIKKPRVSTRGRSNISDEAFKALIAVGDKQPYRNMKGGVGIPGGRRLQDVRKFELFQFDKIPAQTGAILQKSRDVRGNKKIKSVREQVKQVNRKVEFAPNQMGAHSLHVGNDIAAVWNSEKNGSRVYDYPALAPRLDLRLENRRSGKKVYWKSDKPLNERRGHVAKGMQHLISGNKDEAGQALNQAGLTQRGQKWAFKMSNLMLSEVGREHFGGKNRGRVHTALDHVIGSQDHKPKSFTTVFVEKAQKYAPFAKRGGAKTFK